MPLFYEDTSLSQDSKLNVLTHLRGSSEHPARLCGQDPPMAASRVGGGSPLCPWWTADLRSLGWDTVSAADKLCNPGQITYSL